LFTQLLAKADAGGQPELFDWKHKRVLVTGGNGFLGTALVRFLRQKGCLDIAIPRSRTEDLRSLENCKRVVRNMDIAFHLAANVGGIGYNQEKPGELFYDNITMGVHVMEAARQARVEKVIALGTICSYPCYAPAPFREESIWDGYPEQTNAPYGLAKKMLLVQSQAYRKQYGFNSIVIFPTNLYGPGDKFDPRHSHVIPALIRNIHDAMSSGKDKIVVWGDGSPTREFLYVEDAARALIMAAEAYNRSDPVNIGSGEEISIRDLTSKLSQIMCFRGSIEWDGSKPNGQPRRYVDSTKAFKEFGFKAQVPLSEGLRKTVDWYLRAQRRSAEISSDHDRAKPKRLEDALAGLSPQTNPN
jgi:GDP-L-fucose synthase